MLEKKGSAMTKPTHGIWIDDPVRDVLGGAFWDKLVEHKLTTAAIMLEGLGKGFDPNYKVETLEKIRELAFARDIEIVLTVWPEPNDVYLKEFEAEIGPMLTAAGASGLEFDAEGNWLPIKVKGFGNIDEAGDELVKVVQRVSAAHDVRSELTTYPFHTENSKTADVALHADRLLPQAYSVRKRTDSKGKDLLIDWDGGYGPGKMQRLTLDRAKMVRGVGTTAGPLISCGLAAYDQVWPGKKGEDAMRIAYDAACAYEPVEIRWWSSKWVFGILANGYASRFLKSLG